MKILVLGAGGMAGHVVATALREEGYEVATLSGKNKLYDETHLVDVTEKNVFEKFINNENFDVVVNCIGLLVNQSESRKDLAVYLNSYLPHFLENTYLSSKTKVIHLSTDCVFSGNNAPYSENSAYDGDLFYDRTKALGELKNDKDLTFRMSIIGPDINKSGVGLFNWFYAQSGDISGYSRAIWSGITTIELAKGISNAIRQNLTGIYHLVPSASISKFDLLNLFCEIFDRNDISVKQNDSVIYDKTLINTRTDFDYNVGSYVEMITEMKQWIINHKDLYPHYQEGRK